LSAQTATGIDIPIALTRSKGLWAYVNTASKILASFTTIVKLLADRIEYLEKLCEAIATTLPSLRNIIAKIWPALASLEISQRLVGILKCSLCIALNAFSAYSYHISAEKLINPNLVKSGGRSR